jgi:cytochrome c biogenesis protein CcdA/thiol-disulfide isomerase/thioredoxin
VPVLILIGLLGGLVTGISPCIIPVLPVIFAAGAVSGMPATARSKVSVGGAAPGSTPSEPEGGVPEPDGDAPEPATDVLLSIGGAAGPGSAGGGAAVVLASTPSELGVVVPDLDHQQLRRLRRRPYAVVGGLVLSFSVVTLIGSSLLSALGLPQDLLRNIGLVVLGLVAIGLIVPAIGELLEQPFARLVRVHQHDQRGGLVLGLSLGLLFVPCAGPVLAAITVVGANHRIGVSAIVLTLSFAVGVGIPLLVFAFAGQRLAGQMKVVRNRAAVVRKVVGVVLLAVAVLIGFNVTSGLQTALPGYTDALTNTLESNSTAKSALGSVTGNHGTGALATCIPSSPILQHCGQAPAFTGISQWLNTPGDKPLTLAGLKGKVVLVDIWTYSCINCQRSLPHVEAWNKAYAADGLTIVGVHTPEFAFEHVVSNVSQATQQLGVTYPIAIDNNYGTWDAYQNQYWPAEYLIDATGQVRHVDFGEGGYSQTETFVRQLLTTANPTVQLPGRTDLPDTTPTEPTTPESYLGAQHPNTLDGQTIQEGVSASYVLPATVVQDEYAYGGQWKIGSEASTAGSDASIQLRYQAKDVYLVLGGTGHVTVSVDGVQTKVVTVGGEPKLYQLVGTPQSQNGLLTLSVSPGVSAYDFTFG